MRVARRTAVGMTAVAVLWALLALVVQPVATAHPSSLSLPAVDTPVLC